MLQIEMFVIDTIAVTRPLVELIARRDRDLATQYRRALSSAALNLAEGGYQRGARRASHFSIALGSAREAWSALRTAGAWGYIAPPDPALADRFDRIMATLYRLAHR